MPYRQLSPALKLKAEENGEVEDQIPEKLNYLKTWLDEVKYINARRDDQWLLSFLRGTKYNLEKTKRKLESYYTLKSLVPEFYQNRDPFLPEIQEILKLGMFLPLPKTKSPGSPRIVLVREGIHTDKMATFKVRVMIQDIQLFEDDDFVIGGLHVIEDVNNVGVSHVPTPSNVKKMILVYTTAYPVRLKGAHFINLTFFFNSMFKVVANLSGEKIAKRYYFYTQSNIDKLYEVIPKEILPREYGGMGPTIAEITEEWKAKVESYKDWFQEDENYKTNESKRPGKPKTSEEYFGITGLFTKFSV